MAGRAYLYGLGRRWRARRRHRARAAARPTFAARWRCSASPASTSSAASTSKRCPEQCVDCRVGLMSTAYACPDMSARYAALTCLPNCQAWPSIVVVATSVTASAASSTSTASIDDNDVFDVDERAGRRRPVPARRVRRPVERGQWSDRRTDVAIGSPSDRRLGTRPAPDQRAGQLLRLALPGRRVRRRPGRQQHWRRVPRRGRRRPRERARCARRPGRCCSCSRPIAPTTPHRSARPTARSSPTRRRGRLNTSWRVRWGSPCWRSTVSNLAPRGWRLPQRPRPTRNGPSAKPPWSPGSWPARRRRLLPRPTSPGLPPRQLRLLQGSLRLGHRWRPRRHRQPPPPRPPRPERRRRRRWPSPLPHRCIRRSARSSPSGTSSPNRCRRSIPTSPRRLLKSRRSSANRSRVVVPLAAASCSPADSAPTHSSEERSTSLGRSSLSSSEATRTRPRPPPPSSCRSCSRVSRRTPCD